MILDNPHFNKFFIYDETSPSCLRWRVDRYSGKNKCKLEVKAGDIAGTLSNLGYYRVWAPSCEGVKRRQIMVHRVIWQMLKGSIEKATMIDHINRDSKDNRINNLRITNSSLNNQNRKKKSTNKSGFTGVYFTSKDSPCWVAQWMENGVKVSKRFTVKRFGGEAKQMAIDYRKMMIDELNSKGAVYEA